MDGQGPFLWLSSKGPPAGYWSLPAQGMCVSAFVFVVQDGRLLLGKYADDHRWEALAGLDEGRRRAHGRGWTVPASHLKFGEEPRAAGRRVAEDILGIPGLHLSEPRVESDQYVPARFPELGMHYDIWLFFTVQLPGDAKVERPSWYAELAFQDVDALRAEDYARGHEDVVARWLAAR